MNSSMEPVFILQRNLECKSNYDTDSIKGKNERKDEFHEEVEHETDINQPLTLFQKFLLTFFKSLFSLLPECIRVLLKEILIFCLILFFVNLEKGVFGLLELQFF